MPAAPPIVRIKASRGQLPPTRSRSDVMYVAGVCTSLPCVILSDRSNDRFRGYEPPNSNASIINKSFVAHHLKYAICEPSTWLTSPPLFRIAHTVATLRAHLTIILIHIQELATLPVFAICYEPQPLGNTCTFHDTSLLAQSLMLQIPPFPQLSLNWTPVEEDCIRELQLHTIEQQ